MKKSPFPRWLVLTFGLAVAAVVTGGLSFYRNARQHEQQHAVEELQEIARVKADHVGQWRAERLGDASVIMDSIYLSEGIAAWMETKSPAALDKLLQRLRSTAKHYQYRDVMLADAGGHVLLSVAGRGGRLHVETVQALRTALRERRAVLSNLHAGGDLPVHLGVIAPIFAGGSETGEPLGAVILQCGAEQYLYPLIQSWPVPSASGETVFFRRDGDDVLFLSPLRFQEDAALNLRIPLTRTDVPAVMAVQGKTGIIEGTDYRGVEVLSFLRPVLDSPWFLVVKQDTAEIFAPLRQTAWATATVVALLILTLALAAGFVWRQRTAAQKIRLLNENLEQRVHDRTAELHASESRYRLLMQHATDVLWVIDAESQTCLYISPSVERMLGFTDEEMIGRNVAEVVAPTSLEHIEATTPVRIERMMSGDACTFTDEIEVIHKAGHTVWTEMNMRFMVNSDTRRVEGSGVMRDITDRKKVEVEREEARALLQKVVDGLPDQMIMANLDHTVVLANRMARENWGSTSPEIVGMKCHEVSHGCSTPCDSVEHPCPMEEVLRTKGVVTLEHIHHNADGDDIPVEVVAAPIFDENGEVVQILESSRDITERKRAEGERRELEKQVHAKQKLAAIGMLACGMGHEINNPIMGIINYAQLIADRLNGKDDALETFAGEIGIEAERIAGIIRGLSAFATRDFAPHVPTEVSDLVESAVTATRDTLAQDEITVVVDLPDSLPKIACDRAQLGQVVTSLIDNARDALNERYPGLDPNKTIRITARTTSNCEDSGSPTSRNPQSAIRISVEDHGTGIPLDAREHIFEPFFTTKDKSAGAGNIGKGLGLFVSHATVQEHGGTLTVESEPGQWTRFCIELPAVPADVPQAQTVQAGFPVDVDAAANTAEKGGKANDV